MNMGAIITIENWISLLTLFFGIIGGVFALVQWLNTNRIRRAEFINQVIETLRFDKEMVEVMYLIEYGYDWYDGKFHGSKELEYKVDKLLSYLSYICYLKSTGNIKKKEFEIFTYDLNRTCISLSVQSYLWNLHHFSKKNSTPCTFEHLINYGNKTDIFGSDFNDAKSKKYVKHLIF